MGDLEATVQSRRSSAASSSRVTSWCCAGTLERLFPSERLSRADYFIGFSFITICFAFFFHIDMWGVGWDSLNYIFGRPLEFYENCKKIRGGGQNMRGTPYPPPIYLIFALWLYPFKLLGFITGPETLPLYLTYWLKTLTTIAYITSGVIFHHIAREYSLDEKRARYAAVAWLTMPLALFSQFVFSQYDIFYVLLTLVGLLMFLRGALLKASVFFGAAITFKYFPVFVFLPLLLLYEKRLSRIVFYCLIFTAPMAIIEVLYRASPAYIEGVKNHIAIGRIYATSMDIGGGWLLVYVLIACSIILCALAFFTEVAENARTRVAAYLFLVASILPFLFIVWHPQWVMFFAPAIVLTSMLSHRPERFMLFDLAGMFLFVATVSLSFQDNVDAAMFRGEWIGLDFEHSFFMEKLFKWFGPHSANVFLSGFWAYLVVQIILKYRPLLTQIVTLWDVHANYHHIRQGLYIGLLIFLVPAFYSIYRGQIEGESFINNMFGGAEYGGLLTTRSFEQTFIARGKAIKQVSLLLGTLGRDNVNEISVEIIDTRGEALFRSNRSLWGVRGNAWHDFVFDPVPVVNNARYTIRLTSPTGASGISWLASFLGDSYPEGEAIVDGNPQKSDFAFRVGFIR